jgi:hypothetical protein
MSRIEWDPLDTDVATCLDGVVTIHESGTARVMERDVLDMRWLADGVIMTITKQPRLEWWRNGAVVRAVDRRLDFATYVPYTLVGAYLAAGGERFVAFDAPAEPAASMSMIVTVATIEPGTLVRPDIHEFAAERLSVALSGDGSRLAIGYDTYQPGRGLIVFDVERDKVLDRTWSAQPLDRTHRMLLAFSHDGRRLVQGISDGPGALGVIRPDRSEIYSRDVPGGHSAVALEYRGDLVAYAYREVPAGARGRLRFDYLSPAVAGPTRVEVLDTQTLEVELPDVVAMAFSHDRRRLACLASTGAIEIVPVP